MTPQEQELVEELFDRLAKLENSPRDPAAERVIADGLRRAPQATYALMQTALVQDEALSAPTRVSKNCRRNSAALSRRNSREVSSTVCATPSSADATREARCPRCARKRNRHPQRRRPINGRGSIRRR